MIEFAYAATTPGNTPAAGGGMSSIVLIVLMVAIFYFMLIRPESKRKKQAEEMRSSLQKGDWLTTIGGAQAKRSTRRVSPAWNPSTRNMRKRKQYWTPVVFHGKLSRKKKRISTSSLHSSTSRSVPSGKRSSCAARLQTRPRSCSAMSLHRKNPTMRKKRRKHAPMNRR